MALNAWVESLLPQSEKCGNEIMKGSIKSGPPANACI